MLLALLNVERSPPPCGWAKTKLAGAGTSQIRKPELVMAKGPELRLPPTDGEPSWKVRFRPLTVLAPPTAEKKSMASA